jgi:chromosome segregation ATPase
MNGRGSRRAAVDREELFQAANDLLQEGKAVTALALLEALGGGSLRTIYKYLGEWEARQKEPAQAAISKVPEAVQNAFASTWLAAVAEAAKDVAAEKEKACEEVRAAQKKFEEALDGIQKLEAQGSQDAAQIEQLKVQVLQLQEALTHAGNENAGLKATAEQLKQQVSSQQSELDRVHKELEQQRKQHQEQLDRMTSDYAKLQERTKTQIEQLQEQVTSLQKKSEQVENDRALVTIKLEQTAERLKTAEVKQESANKEREAAIKEAAGLKGQVKALTEQNTELMSKLSERPYITQEQMRARLAAKKP